MRCSSVPLTCSALPNGHDHRDAGRTLSSLRQRARDPARAPTTSSSRALRDHFVRRCRARAVCRTRYRRAVAALGLVHVMRGDEHRDAFGGERVDVLPELAARFRIDARRGLVEQQQLRCVQQARGERESLFPAARELARELRAAALEAEPLERSRRLHPGGRAPRTRAR